jgi:hypothetical protein
VVLDISTIARRRYRYARRIGGVVTFAEMRGTHKLLATLAIFALMGIEIKGIRKDPKESDLQAAEQRNSSDA